ncbi:MAG TPA: MCE family protein [Mycobacteriales bacterium]|nr:MCE family protein [Mycobacteriales bacterium]
MEQTSRVLVRRGLGLAFLVLLGFLLWLAVAIYDKTFVSTVKVTLRVDNVGHQLEVPADVKLRGIIVGTVTKISSNGHYGSLQLSLQPGKVPLIPSNVRAEILPKTLFGEKFVDLVIPTKPSATPIARDDVIGLDRSSTAIETEKVFDDLVPLLDALQPVALDLTLTNLAESLRGRGNALGDNLTRLDAYLASLNPDLGNIQRDISGLADLAVNYDAATPDLLATARQLSVNARTLVAKGDVLVNFLAGTKGFADEATSVLTRNETNLVQLAKISRPTLELLARYSPVFSCMAKGFSEVEDPLNAAWGAQDADARPALHIRLQTIVQPKGYTTAEAPDYSIIENPNYNGPRCYGLPAVPKAPNNRTPPLNRAEGAATAPNTPIISGTGVPSMTSADNAARFLLAPSLGVTAAAVPDLVTTLFAPQLAGMKVDVS